MPYSRAYYEAHREEILQREREWYRKHHIQERGYDKKNRERINAYCRKRYAENKEIRERSAERAKKYYKEHLEARRAYHRRHYAEHKKEYFEKQRQRIKENPLPHRAHALVQYHKIPFGPQCESCGATVNLERHHPDYNKPLDVQTLCSSCNKLFRSRGENANALQNEQHGSRRKV